MFHLRERLRRVREQFFTKLIAQILFMVIFLSCLGGYLGLSNYPEWRGETAAYKAIPEPPNSEVVSKDTVDAFDYRNEAVLYTSDTSLEELRDWFEEHISMEPAEGQPENEAQAYVSIPESLKGAGLDYLLVELSAFVMGAPSIETNPDCFSVFIGTHDAFLDSSAYFNSFFAANLDGLGEKSLIAVQRCWPHDE
jgi:hypothetical protein